MQTRYNFKADIWSLGIVLYIVLCGYAPFFDDNVSRLFRKIMAGKFAFPPVEWDGVSAGGIEADTADDDTEALPA